MKLFYIECYLVIQSVLPAAVVVVVVVVHITLVHLLSLTFIEQ